MKPKGNPKPCNNPPNRVPNLPYDPDSDPSLSDSSSSQSSDSSDDEYYKQRGRAKKDKIKAGVKRVLITQSKRARSLQPSY